MQQTPVVPTITRSTLESERQVFLSLLRGNPGFLLKHVPALTRAVYRRIRTTIALRLNTRHRGRKMWPHWLDPNAADTAGADVRGPFTVMARYPSAAAMGFGEAALGEAGGLGCAAQEP